MLRKRLGLTDEPRVEFHIYECLSFETDDTVSHIISFDKFMSNYKLKDTHEIQLKSFVDILKNAGLKAKHSTEYRHMNLGNVWSPSINVYGDIDKIINTLSPKTNASSTTELIETVQKLTLENERLKQENDQRKQKIKSESISKLSFF